MAAIIRPPFYMLLGGTSLSEGRLHTPDHPWDLRLRSDMRRHANCKGEVTFVNAAAGSQQSSYLMVQCQRLAGLKFSHALLEGCTINDVAPLSDAFGNPPAVVSEAQQLSNLTNAVAALRAANPDIVIWGQTMSPASSGDGFRTDLQARYAAEIAMWESLDVEVIDNNANWPKPLNPAITVNTDGLHPLWANGFELYSYPLIRSTMEAAMGAYWS